MHFLKKLKKVIREKNSHLCIGLDSDLNKIPKFLFRYVDSVYLFNKLIIEVTKDLACAYKINIAFYERCGSFGWNTLTKTVKLIPGDVISIADAKKGRYREFF